MSLSERRSNTAFSIDRAGPDNFEMAIIPAQAGIQYFGSLSTWTPAFAGVTASNMIWA